MLAGIQLTEIVVGTGALAERGKVAAVHLHGWRPDGLEILTTHSLAHPQPIHLGKRDFIIGIERGIEGMRVGGRRRLEIISELAGGRVAPGEAARGLCRWQFTLHETGSGGFSITKPIPTLTWRHARSLHCPVQWEAATAQNLIAGAQSVPHKFPQECLAHEALWADHSEKANTITRDQVTNRLCVYVQVYERGATLCSYHLREDSPALMQSDFYQLASQTVEAHLRGTFPSSNQKP